ncbi:MAG: DEAD/DEAH box helicase [Bacteroidales bacterium]|nr:DEAD/DEAH box helicase [Bacteroidales bacterium]
MLIFKPRKAVILKTKNPKKFLDVIPTAKEFVYKGLPLVAVPHKPDETKVLRNLGVNVPAPMNYYYPYDGRFKPFEVQRKTAEFASMNNRCFILNSMGLGKTVTSLWALDYMRSIGMVKRALVVCPISVMERAWGDEIFRTFPNLKFNVLYGSREKRLKLLAEDADIYVINTDGLKIIQQAMADRPDINLIIIDEVALFRNPSTARWKTADDICNKQFHGERRVWGLTGSPIPNAPTDAYGQIKLVTPNNPDLPKYFGRFRDLVMYQRGQFNWVNKPDAVETVFRIMQPAIRFSLDDAIDLPPQVIQVRETELSPEQKKAYKEMMNKLATELKEGKVLAVNEAVKASKLLQICCGAAYGEHGETVPVPCKPRLEALDEVVCESEGKTIVFIPFTSALHQAADYLSGHGHTVAIVDGDTPKAQRDETFYNFQNADNPQVIIANPATMSHGLTLTAATTICWFGPCYNNEIYQQACARVRRPGQKRSTVIVHLVSTELEKKVYDRIEKKQSMQGLLLDMVNEQSVA